MKRSTLIAALLLCAALSLSLVLLLSCNGGEKKSAPSQAATAREAWRRSLTDSIDSLSALSQSLQERLMMQRATLDSLAAGFDVIADPVLVEKYRVARGWKGYDSTSGTGILARLLEDNSIELVGTLSGGRFTSLRFSSQGESVSTASVAPDGANNYSIGTTCRVAFTGERADSAAAFVAAHLDAPVTLSFMGAGRPVELTLSKAQKQMIAATWQLNSALALTRRIEAQIPVLYNKIELFRSEKDKVSAKK